jgi:hypothetical protein
LFASGYSGPVNIFPGSPDASYLKHYKQHKNILIHPMPQDQWDRIKDWSPERRINYNWCRVMTPNYNNIIMEDDVIFHDDAIFKILHLARMIEEDGFSEYILSVFNTREQFMFDKDYYQQVGPIVGQQCVFYPQKVVTVLKNLLWHNSIVEKAQAYNALTGKQWDSPGDCLLGHLAEKIKMPVFITSRSLVQHIGAKSSTDAKKVGEVDPYAPSF